MAVRDVVSGLVSYLQHQAAARDTNYNKKHINQEKPDINASKSMLVASFLLKILHVYINVYLNMKYWIIDCHSEIKHTHPHTHRALNTLNKYHIVFTKNNVAIKCSFEYYTV